MASAAASDLGPALPPLSVLRATANEAYQLALIMQHAVRTEDHLRAARTYEKLKALVGSTEPTAGG